MTDQRLVDELERALTDEVYDGGGGALSEEKFAKLVHTLATTAAAVVAEAHTPTGGEREALLLAQEVRSWANSREGWNRYEVDLGMRVEKTLNALAAGFRRSEVPEPSADRVELAAATIAVAELVRTHRTWGDLIDPQKDAFRRVAREVLRVTDPLPTPSPSDEGYAEFEDWEQEMFRHQPVLSMQDGSIAGCQCLDRVFVKGREDWGTHLASVITARIPRPQDNSERRAAYQREHRAELMRQERAALRAAGGVR